MFSEDLTGQLACVCVWLRRSSGGEFVGFVMSVPSRAMQTIVSSHSFIAHY